MRCLIDVLNASPVPGNDDSIRCSVCLGPSPQAVLRQLAGLVAAVPFASQRRRIRACGSAWSGRDPGHTVSSSSRSGSSYSKWPRVAARSSKPKLGQGRQASGQPNSAQARQGAGVRRFRSWFALVACAVLCHR